MTADSSVDPPPLAAWSLGGFALSLLAMLIAFYYPFLAGQKSFYLSDVTYYYEPFTRFIGEALAQNRLPLWNPYCYCGMSQIAVPMPGIFYPPDWIFAFLPFNQALAVFLILHQWLAGLGGYLLVRLWRWEFAASWLCGLVLALCGYMVGFQANYSLPAAAAWAPLCWWGLASIKSEPDDTNLLFVALTAVLMFLLVTSGRPELFSIIILILGFYVAGSFTLGIKAGNKAKALGTLFWRILALGAAALMAMPSILPAREWAALSPRASGMTANEVFLWSANWYDFLCLCVSQPLGDLYLRGSKYVALASSRANYLPYLTSAFVGPCVLTLSLWGALDRSWRWRSLCLVALLVGIIATLGNQTFIFPSIVGAFPALSVFRYPIKLMILPVWCLSILAARGTCLIQSSLLSARAMTAAAACWALLLAGSLVLFISPELLSKLVSNSSSQALVATDIGVAAQALIARSAVASCALGLLLCLGAWAARRWKLNSRATTCALLLATTATLLWHGVSYGRQGTDAGYFSQPSHVREELAKLMPGDAGLFSGQTRLLPLYYDPLVCPVSYHDKGLGSQTPYFYQYGRQLLLPNTNVDAKLSGSYGYEAAITADYRRIYHAVRNKSAPVALAGKTKASSSSKANDMPLSTFCRMTSTEIVLTQCYGSGDHPQDIPLLSRDLFDKLLEDRAMNVRIYRVKRYLPRAYISKAWILAGSHEDVIDQVSHPDRSGFDPETKTLVEPYTVLGYPPKPGVIDNDALDRSWVKFLEDLPEHVSLSVKADQDSLVVLADHFYPGWNARLDNIPVDIHCANGLQRAVFVRAGSHLLEFDYQPESLQTAFGCANFALTIVLGMVLLVGARKFWRLAKRQSRGW